RARSWARRRRLPVPTTAPSGSESSVSKPPHRASRGSARSGTPTIARPSGSRLGTSLAECTARSTSSRSSASSISFTKRDLSPATRASPEVRMGTTSTSASSSSATMRACASASALPRVPGRRSLAVDLGKVHPARLVLAQPLVDDGVGALVEGRDGGHHVEPVEPAREPLGLLVNERPRASGLRLPPREVLCHLALQVVHVV